jgi:Ca-activated chloride channel family protein
MLSLDLPWAFLLLPLPLLVRWLLPRADTQQAALLAPAWYRELLADGAASAGSAAPARGRLLLALLLWLLLVVAASGPRWIGDPVALPASGRDLLLAVDISGSMQIEDMQAGNQLVSRLIAVKSVVDDFVGRRTGDRLGLILFGTRAYLQAPLTFDRATVRRFLNEAQIGFAGEETAIGDAIGLAIKRLRDRPGERHVLILLTDGANTAGSVAPLAAARIAAEQGVVIYTIGIGADELVLPGLFGSQFGARRVNPSADLDEPTMQEIAALTGGRYFRARDPVDLAQIYALLDQLEPVATETQSVRPQRALFHWPLAAALLISFVATARLLWRNRQGVAAR